MFARDKDGRHSIEERSKTIIEKGKKAGRTCILTEEQSRVLRTTIFDKNPSAVVEQATE